MTEYQKQCVISAIQGINTMLTNSNLSINDVNSTNMTETLMTIAAQSMLQLFLVKSIFRLEMLIGNSLVNQ